MQRSERLLKAGFPLQFQDEFVPFSVWLDPVSINATLAMNTSYFGNLEYRLKELSKFAHLASGLPPVAVAACPMDANTQLVKALLLSMKENDRELAPIARWHAVEEMRGDFRRWAIERNTQLAFEGMAGLSKLGLTDDDIPALVEQANNLEDLPRACFALAILSEQKKLKAVQESGAIDHALDNNEMLACLVDFALSGAYDSLDTAFSQINHWAESVAILRLVQSVAADYPSFDILDFLLERVVNDNDSDVIVSFSWAIGAYVKVLGFDGVQHHLEYCRDNLSNHQNHLCFVLNGALRSSVTTEEAELLMAILNEMQFDDTDVTRSIGRVRDHLSGQYIPSNWLFRGGYGRGVDIYDPTGCYVPQAVLNAISTQQDSNPLTTIDYMHRVQSDALMVSMMASRLLHFHPGSVNVLSKWLTGNLNNECKSGVAMALCFTKIEHSVSPVLLRCRVGGSEFGGPIHEEAGTFGELLAYYEEWNMRDAAKSLMYSGSETLRQQAAAYFRGRIPFDTSDDIREALYKTGVPQGIQHSPPQTSAAMCLSAGLPFENAMLIEEIKNMNDVDRKTMWANICEWFMNADRNPMLSLAANKDLWALYDIKDIQQQTLRMLSEQYGNEREIGCLISQTVGAPILEGANSKHIQKRLLSFVNDSSNYLSDAAKRACRTLSLEAVLINPETLRQNILNGGADVDVWIDRLLNFVQEANDVGELRTLARLAVLWEVVGMERLSGQWFSWAQSDNWIHREIACILVGTYAALLEGDDAQNVFDLMQSLTQDNDSDVQREARIACDIHGIEYSS